MNTWTSTETSEAFGITVQQLNTLARSGVIPKEGRGQFHPIKTTLAFVTYVRNMAGESQGLAAARVSSEEARKELWYQQARKAKVAADIAERSVVEIDQVRADMTELLQTIATTIKASSMAREQINDLFKVIREGGTAFDVKYGWRS